MLWKCKIKYTDETNYKEEIRYSEGPLQLDSSNIESAIVS